MCRNNAERKYALFTCFVGTGLFAFITGEITALATSRQACQQALGAKLDQVKEFMAYYRLPKRLTVSVRNYYRESFAKGYFSSDDILNDLPLDLARQVEFSIARTKFINSPWFRVLSLQKSHDVHLSEADHAVLATLSNTAVPIKLSSLQHKKDYEVTVPQEADSMTFKANAKELTFIPPTSNTSAQKLNDIPRVEWTRRIKKADVKHPLFNFHDECSQLYSSMVEALTTREMRTHSVYSLHTQFCTEFEYELVIKEDSQTKYKQGEEALELAYLEGLGH